MPEAAQQRLSFDISRGNQRSLEGTETIYVCLEDIELNASCVLPQVDWAAVPAAGWAALLWAAWGTSFAAHSGICWAVGRCAAVIPSIYGCLQVLC